MAKKAIFGAVIFLGGAWGAALGAQEPVDLLLHSGKVFTADDLTSIHSAVAVDDGRVVAVGGEELTRRFRGDRTVDLAGRLVTPGFNDTHIHVRGNPRRYIDFSGTASIEEFKEKVRRKAEELGPGEWITGWGWSEDEMAEKRNPTRWDLDEVAPDNPVIVSRAGGHSAVANSLALEMAEVDENTPQPEHGVIEKDEEGRLNGIIREAQGMVSRLVPDPDPEEVRESLADNLQGLLELGITSIIQAGGSVEGYREWQEIYQERWPALPRAAFQIRPRGETPEENVASLRETGLMSGDGDHRLRVGPVKLLADGGFTGPAAWTLEHYRGQPDFYGHERYTSNELYRIVKGGHDLGWQFGIHAIGDAAIKTTVDVFARVLDASPRTDHRHYLNHFTVTPPEETLRKMAEYDIHIAQQPNFTYTLEGRYERNLTEERAAHNNPLRTPMNHGIFMALGSDILPIGPMVGLYAAVTRKGMSGGAFAADDEAISMPEALVGYTRNGAYLTFEEEVKGTLEPGMLADLVVLDRDLLTMDPEGIMNVKVDLTVVDGRVVYERGGRTTMGARSGTKSR